MFAYRILFEVDRCVDQLKKPLLLGYDAQSEVLEVIHPPPSYPQLFTKVTPDGQCPKIGKRCLTIVRGQRMYVSPQTEKSESYLEQRFHGDPLVFK